jgi:hypothetical protein
MLQRGASLGRMVFAYMTGHSIRHALSPASAPEEPGRAGSAPERWPAEAASPVSLSRPPPEGARKEFDAVIIVEGQYRDRLLDWEWDSRRITRQRRLLRVAITRARHVVVLIRPADAVPLASPPF